MYLVPIHLFNYYIFSYYKFIYFVTISLIYLVIISNFFFFRSKSKLVFISFYSANLNSNGIIQEIYKRYPIFSFLSYLFESFFEFQQGVTERLFFNETFDL